MKVEIETGGAEANLIRAYGPGHIKVNQQLYGASVLITPGRAVQPWTAADFADLGPSHFEAIAALVPEVVIIGTGARLRFLPSQVVRPLVEAQVGFEVMDTGAACRTYNILAAEGRKVVAALLMIEPSP